MLKVDQKTGAIYLTRGDSATLDLGIKKADCGFHHKEKHRDC